MKRMQVLAVCLGLMLMFGANNVYAGGDVKLGIDFNGDHEFSGYGSTLSGEVDTGVALSMELFASINPNIDLGGGVIVQLPRTVELYGTSGKFSFIPFYGMIRVKSDSNGMAPYGIGQIGYNLFNGDSDYKGDADLNGGLYYGLGAGILFNKRFLLELLYSVNQGEVEYQGLSMDINNTQFTLNFGYNF